MGTQDSITVRTYEALANLLSRFRAGHITIGEFKQQVLETFQEGGTAWSDPVGKAQEYLMGGPRSEGVLFGSQLDPNIDPGFKLPFQALDLPADDRGLSRFQRSQTEADVTADADFTTILQDATPREILSRTRRGRGDIWSSFLENLPGSRNFSNLLQRGMQESFNPLSAQFALQSNIPGPAGGYGPQDFRSFLQAGPQRFTQQDFMESLGPLRMAFGDDPPQTSYGLRERFENEALQNNLMAQIMGGNIAPGLREFLPGIISRKRSALFDVDPEANIWRQFLADPTSI